VLVADEDVPWFDVPVNDALCVRVIQRGSNLIDDCQSLPGCQPYSGFDQLLERAAGNQFHHEVESFRLLDEMVQKDDVVVSEFAYNLGFADKTITRLGDLIRRELREPELFYREVTTDIVQCAVDHPAAAAANFFRDPVLPDPSHGVGRLVAGR